MDHEQRRSPQDNAHGDRDPGRVEQFGDVVIAAALPLIAHPIEEAEMSPGRSGPIEAARIGRWWLLIVDHSAVEGSVPWAWVEDCGDQGCGAAQGHGGARKGRPRKGVVRISMFGRSDFMDRLGGGRPGHAL